MGGDGWTERRLDALRADLLALRNAIEEEEARQRPRIEAALPKHQLSATNLAHYLGLRKRDVRPLQLELAALGLSSLGRSEGHVRDTLLRLDGWLAGKQRDAAEPPIRSTGRRPKPSCPRIHGRCSGRGRPAVMCTSW